jgi:hypothetical protein
MQIIPPVLIEDNTINIPALGPEGKFTCFVEVEWRDGEAFEDMLTRCHERNSCYSDHSRLFYLFEEDKESSEEFELLFYPIKDKNGHAWFLVTFDKVETFDMIENSFCIPRHIWNVYQIIKSFSSTWKMDLGNG